MQSAECRIMVDIRLSSNIFIKLYSVFCKHLLDICTKIFLYLENYSADFLASQSNINLMEFLSPTVTKISTIPHSAFCILHLQEASALISVVYNSESVLFKSICDKLNVIVVSGLHLDTQITAVDAGGIPCSLVMNACYVTATLCNKA